MENLQFSGMFLLLADLLLQINKELIQVVVLPAVYQGVSLIDEMAYLRDLFMGAPAGTTVRAILSTGIAIDTGFE